MRRLLICLLIISVVFACKTSKDLAFKLIQPISVKMFLDQPFGVDESINSFKKILDGVKLKKLIRRNKHDNQKVDTIFQFYTRKSDLFIYKTYFNREMLLGGVIADNKIPLANGVKPGMKRDAFFKAFTDLDVSQNDSVELNSHELMRKFTFIFDSKGVLKKIRFSSYVD